MTFDVKFQLDDKTFTLNETSAAAAEAAAERAEAAAIIAEQAGLSADVKEALLQIAQKVAYIDEHGQDYYDDLYDALYAITAITLNTTSISLQTIGATYQLTATTVPEGGRVTWTSSNEAVATVSSTGLVTSVGYGSCTITASSGSVSASCAVAVSQVALTSISAVYTQSGTVYEGATLDSLKSDLVVTASWSDSTTSTVASTDYTLSGILEVGTSIITVSYGGKTDTFNVAVTGRTLLYSWDFTGDSPFVDSVSEKTIVPNGTVNTDTTNGLSFGTVNSYCNLDLVGNDLVGKDVEIEFGDMVSTASASSHQRVLITASQYGFICKNTGHVWNLYGSVSGSNTWQTTGISQNNIANTVVKFSINSASDIDVYQDSNLVLENGGFQLGNSKVWLGSSASSATIVYIKTLKIYER